MLEKHDAQNTNKTRTFVKELFKQVVGMEQHARHKGFQAFDFRPRTFANDPTYQYVPIINRTSSRAIYRTQGWFMHVRE